MIPPFSIIDLPSNTTPFSMLSAGAARSPFTRAGLWSSIESLALMLPMTSPFTTTDPQLILAETFAVSPTTSKSVVVISPVNMPSIRTCPLKLSLPSTTEPGPSKALSPASAGLCSSRIEFLQMDPDLRRSPPGRDLASGKNAA